MKFEDMCKMITSGDRAYAYRRSYPDITTLVGLGQTKGGLIMYYFDRGVPQIPFYVNKDVVDATDWEVCDEVTDRFCIKQYMTMPKVKEFLLDVYDFYNSGNPTDVLPNQFKTNEYVRRMHEAVELGIFHPDKNIKQMVITDIGYDLIKQIDQ